MAAPAMTPDDDGGHRNRHHLQEVDEKDQPAFRAQRFERGDLVAFAVEECAHRLAGADAADGQRRQPHQRQEHRHLFDKTADARRGIVAVADFPAAIGKGVIGVVLEAAMEALGGIATR